MSAEKSGEQESVPEVPHLDGSSVLHCQQCGAEGETLDNLKHAGGCPGGEVDGRRETSRTPSNDDQAERVECGERYSRVMSEPYDASEELVTDAEVNIDIGEEAYRALRRGFESVVEDGYTSSFETFVFNHCATAMDITVDGDPINDDELPPGGADG